MKNISLVLYVLNNVKQKLDVQFDDRFFSVVDYSEDDVIQSYANHSSEQYAKYGALIGQYQVKNTQKDFEWYGVVTPNRMFLLNDEETETKVILKGADIGLKSASFNVAFDIDEDTLTRALEKDDFITVEPVDVTLLGKGNVMEVLYDDIYHWDQDVIFALLKSIEFKYPKILKSANQYLRSKYYQGQNIWFAKSDLADAFLDFQFSVLSSMERRLKLENAGEERCSLFPAVSSHLLGIYALYIENQKKVSVGYRTGISCRPKKKRKPITPAFPENNVALVFSSSDGFSPYLGVALQSLIDHITPENNYDIIVLEKSIKDESKAKLYSICESQRNVSLRFVNTKDIVSGINFYVPTKDLSEETYYTVIVPWVLANYEKALVLDCDLIFNDDLAKLFNVDIEEYYLAAVKEIVFLGFLNNPVLNVNNNVTDYTIEKLGMDNPYDYFNAGVLLMNLKMFRENWSMDKLLKMIDDNQYRIVEQDLFNTVCARKVRFLDYRWNFMSVLTEPEMLDEKASPSDTTIPNLKLAPRKEYELYKCAEKDVGIYHYLTKFKPWKYPGMKFADIWWSVAKRTVFYEQVFAQMVEYKCRRNNDTLEMVRGSVFDLQIRNGVFDNRSKPRKILDWILPPGTRRRKLANRMMPTDSKRLKFLKKIYRTIRGKK